MSQKFDINTVLENEEYTKEEKVAKIQDHITAIVERKSAAASRAALDEFKSTLKSEDEIIAGALKSKGYESFDDIETKFNSFKEIETKYTELESKYNGFMEEKKNAEFSNVRIQAIKDLGIDEKYDTIIMPFVDSKQFYNEDGTIKTEDLKTNIKNLYDEKLKDYRIVQHGQQFIPKQDHGKDKSKPFGGKF